MANGFKSGGRIKGVSKNKPKVSTDVAAIVVAPVTTAPPAAPPGAGLITASRARARGPKRTPLINRPLTVEMWPITRLVEYGRNPRNNDGVVGRMAEAITKYGFRVPIVARSDGSVVDGHLRLKAARKLHLAEVPVALADDLTEADVKAFRLLVNRSATWATWNFGDLRLEVGELRAMRVPVEMTGFDDGELQILEERPTLPKPVRRTQKTVECPKCHHAFAP